MYIETENIPFKSNIINDIKDNSVRVLVLRCFTFI